jgi:hypothetical protein
MKFPFASEKFIKFFGRYIAAGLMVIIVLLCAAFYISGRPKKLTSYEGVTLGMGMAEVKYILGYPDSVLHPKKRVGTGKSEWQAFQIHASKEDVERSPNGVNDFYDWQYEKIYKRLDIGFGEGTSKVRSIGCYVDLQNAASVGVCAINGIKTNDLEEVVYDKFGEPSSSDITGVTKTIEYKNLNMKIYLTKKHVYYIKVEEIN